MESEQGQEGTAGKGLQSASRRTRRAFLSSLDKGVVVEASHLRLLARGLGSKGGLEGLNLEQMHFLDLACPNRTRTPI